MRGEPFGSRRFRRPRCIVWPTSAGTRPIPRIGVGLAWGGALLLLIGLIAPPPIQAQGIQGHLWDDESGRPIVNGVVALFDSLGAVVARTLSSEKGEFFLNAPGPGDYTFRAVGLGYQSTVSGRILLGEGEVAQADLYMRPQPVELEPLSISAERVRGFLEEEGFFERRERGTGGFFLTPGQLRARPPITVSEVLDRAPFVEIVRGWNGDTVSMRSFGRRCVPELVVDGYQTNWLPGRAGVVEDWVNFADIIALEVFRGVGELPPEIPTFRSEGLGLNECGLIMIWTVWAEQRAKSRRRDGAP